MKKCFLIITFLSFQVISAQDQVTQYQGKIYDISEVDTNPEFPQGTEAFYKFIGKNFVPPEVDGINGKILTSFVVETDGNISNIKILQDIGFGSKEEMIRVLKKSEKWKPALFGGAPVRVLYKFPVTIKTGG